MAKCKNPNEPIFSMDVHTSITEEDFAEIERVRREQGLSRSAFIRMAIKNQLKDLQSVEELQLLPFQSGV